VEHLKLILLRIGPTESVISSILSILTKRKELRREVECVQDKYVPIPPPGAGAFTQVRQGDRERRRRAEI
jgi:hypothetical protein